MAEVAEMAEKRVLKNNLCHLCHFCQCKFKYPACHAGQWTTYEENAAL